MNAKWKLGTYLVSSEKTKIYENMKFVKIFRWIKEYRPRLDILVIGKKLYSCIVFKISSLNTFRETDYNSILKVLTIDLISIAYLSSN